jgi:hypothetical protein
MRRLRTLISQQIMQSARIEPEIGVDPRLHDPDDRARCCVGDMIYGLDRHCPDDSSNTQYFMTPRSTAMWAPEIAAEPSPASQATTSETSSGARCSS